MKIGIFGGTFDPIHRGHIVSAINYYNEIGLDKMYVIPTGDPPHKSEASVSGSDRLHMAEAAFEEYRDAGLNIEVSDIEIAEEGKSYTYYTVSRLLAWNKTDRIYVYTGTDMFCSIESWFRFEELFKMCIFVSAARNFGDVEKLTGFAERYKKLYGAETRILSAAPLVMSSTEIRDFAAKIEFTPGFGKNYANAIHLLTQKYLTPPVARYIIGNGLYLSFSSEPPIEPERLERIRRDAVRGISEKRKLHILAVKDTALEMAKLLFPIMRIPSDYYRDLEAAAMLHDLTKECTEEVHKEFCIAHGIDLTQDDLASPATLHAITGAYAAKERFGISGRVFDAILKHTTGDADMNIFDMIIFLADYIEPTRRYDVCQSLRAYFFEESSKISTPAEVSELFYSCMSKVCGDTVNLLKSKGRSIHPKTVATLKALNR